MAVKLNVAIEVVDWERAKVLMSELIEVIGDQMGSGDKTKLGFQRKIELGRRTRETKDTFEWLYGEDAPELADLGFVAAETPLDKLLGMTERIGADSVTLSSGERSVTHSRTTNAARVGTGAISGDSLTPWRDAFGEDDEKEDDE